MIVYLNDKVTANELAKLLVAAYGTNVLWCEMWDSIQLDKLTAKEEQGIDFAINRQCDRVEKLLGIDSLKAKLGR